MPGKTKPSGATSYQETAFGILARSKLLKLELQGTKKGLEHIHRQLQDNPQVALAPQFIKELHRISFGWIFPDWAGQYRTIQVTYSGKEAPLYYQIPELMENLCADVQTQISTLPQPSNAEFIEQAVRLLAWFQHRFVYIHPFQDYNGRTARMLTTMLLLQFGLPAVEIRVRTDAHRKQYLKAMQQGDEGNLSLLESLLSEALIEVLS